MINNKIENWIFDLDNTLYPAESKLFDQVAKKIGIFVSENLQLDIESAKKEQKRLYYSYGSTLSGLMQEYDIKPDYFLEYVHDIDYSVLKKNKKLELILSQLPGKKLIYTNGSKKHAHNTINRLGVEKNIESIFDIEDADFLPKPNPDSMLKFVNTFKIEPSSALFAEDIVINLKPASLIGMTTLLVKTNNIWASNVDMSFVHHTTTNLEEWLNLFLKNLQIRVEN